MENKLNWADILAQGNMVGSVLGWKARGTSRSPASSAPEWCLSLTKAIFQGCHRDAGDQPPAPL